MIDQRGFSIYHYIEGDSMYSDVYGIKSGDPANTTQRTIKGIVVGDDFVSMDGDSSGLFIEGYMYTHDTGIKAGDLIGIPREGFRERKYKVESEQILGTTKRVFGKYRLISIEEVEG